MDDEIRRLARAVGQHADYETTSRLLGALERFASGEEKLTAARAIQRDAYFSDVRKLAGVLASGDGDDVTRVEEFCDVVDRGPLNLRNDSGSRYALGLTVAWHDLPAEIDRAIADSGRLSSLGAMRDVLAVSRHAMSGSPHLDARAERALLSDVCMEARRLAYAQLNKLMPPIGSRVAFKRTFTIETDEDHEQVIQRGAMGTVVGFDPRTPADNERDPSETFVRLDDCDFSEPYNQDEVGLYGDEIDVLRVVT